MSTQKPPLTYWIIAVITLLWNSAGVMAYLAKAFATEDMIASLPKAQQTEFLTEFPAWYTAAFAIAVFGGTLGALALLIKRKWAYGLFIISAIGAFAQHIYLFTSVDITGNSSIMPILVLVVCVFLIVYSKWAIKRQWLA